MRKGRIRLVEGRTLYHLHDDNDFLGISIPKKNPYIRDICHAANLHDDLVSFVKEIAGIRAYTPAIAQMIIEQAQAVLANKVEKEEI